MPYLRLKHLFYFLMILSGVSFFAPPRWFDAYRRSPTALFVPISWPSRKIAEWANHRLVGPDTSSSDLTLDDARRENEALKNEVGALRTRVADLEAREITREQMGDIRKWCRPFSVASTDSGPRSSLGIQGASWNGLRNGMVALYPRGIVGQVEGAGVTGARVRLITDTGIRLGVKFVRFDGARYIHIRLPEPDQTVAEGTGGGAMVIRGLSNDAVKKAGLRVKDIAVLNESDWPDYLQGRELGSIKSIGVQLENPQWSKITLEPEQNLLRLNEVLIITHTPDSENRTTTE